VILRESKSQEHKLKLQEVLSDLKALECVLSKIIKMEEEETECFKK